ncbi:MAG TPA: dynamin family protein [Candidatus Hydrogenedentes bacterium]|nr:dynamin family protein [Candidatus Hydrogenedentota bacterium]HPC16022.1 dynamin family protein [Candidatus Hydrogenedentota bacterium]HRT19976.1 dynamin family protein [Candidatus Hydrogenedentota bacterium]HRT64654.1 dynamin family protein [Candidatus Hydrogenedentota bacterium]
MITTQHAENRVWAFRAIGELQTFLGDCDFEGDIGEEQALLDRKWRELRDNKYRVVFLGAFNVGKSALINAILGDEYLPTVLEECTTKITHVVKSDTMKTVLSLSVPATEDEFRALGGLIEACNMGASVERAESGDDLIIVYASSAAKDLLKSLRPLVTVSADEDFPLLKSLRNKFDEIHVHLPTDLLEEDIALVDSPGVHSIAETNEKIAHEIIPNSHLVVCMIESQNAGNEQNREFIEQIVKYRHRKIFFVINKSDQLNKDEIDPLGRRGPAKDLLRSLEGIVDNPEIFFVSALYALVSAQLSNYHLQLSDIEYNNKIKIPWAIQRDLLQCEEPTKGVASYLMIQSNIAALKNRLIDYLYKENREGAILESVCRVLASRAWAYARPLQIKLEMVMDNPRLDELTRTRERLTERLEDLRAQSQNIQEWFQVMAAGGSREGLVYTGYERLVAELFDDKAIEEQVLKPLGQWLAIKENIATAKRASYAPLAAEIQRVVDAFVQRCLDRLLGEAQTVQRRVLDAMGALAEEVAPVPEGLVRVSRGPIGALQAGMAASYFGFLVSGAVLGAVVGAVAWSVLIARPDVQIALNNLLRDFFYLDARLGAGAGAVLGGVLGLLLRGATSTGVRREKLARCVREKVMQLLTQGGKSEVGTVFNAARDQLREGMSQCRAAFAENIRKAFDDALAGLSMEIETVRAEEEEIRRKQEEVVARLEPKRAALAELAEKAHAIAEANASNESAAGVGA